METIHTADRLFVTWDAEPVENGAVAVVADRIAAVGAYEDLRERFPGARVRTWPGGALGPARIHEAPLPDAPSPRERVHAVLKTGAAAVLERYVDSPGLRAAADRNDVAVLPGTPPPPTIVQTARADLAVFDEAGECIATVCAGRLVHRRR
ncbi:imidazolonepropionase-like domain-containing protein [Streptomyces sp. NPDC056683]|uniref:imidazolonepropionase-like domain-containing protein n=1 Tax=Streptomyces sp. NPDC056683 TaxID=3345910 RepID=UPI00368E2B56